MISQRGGADCLLAFVIVTDAVAAVVKMMQKLVSYLNVRKQRDQKLLIEFVKVVVVVATALKQKKYCLMLSLKYWMIQARL